MEGESTFRHEPAAQRVKGLPTGGVPADRMTLCHPVGRDTTNPGRPDRNAFPPRPGPARATASRPG
ncbi:MAG: hypothetical protein C0501_04465 [Isosphaera sp.]|nr:hypothetical protein [Isosphaera sp.]